MQLAFTIGKMEYLDLLEIHENRKSIANSFYNLINNGISGVRKKALQWRFLEICFEKTILGKNIETEFERSKVQYYKFEVSDVLRRFYQSGSRPLEYVFVIKHKREILREGYDIDCDEYPSIHGYYFLARRLNDGNRPIFLPTYERDQIKKVVFEGTRAEFQAYFDLPAINESALLKYFNKNGSAYKEILTLLRNHQKKKWIITNDLNPSHHLLKSIKVVEINQEFALARTVEYFYLRWWALEENEYKYIYRETSTQLQQLIKINERWTIEAGLRSLPSTSLPRRQAEYNKWKKS